IDRVSKVEKRNGAPFRSRRLQGDGTRFVEHGNVVHRFHPGARQLNAWYTWAVAICLCNFVIYERQEQARPRKPWSRSAAGFGHTVARSSQIDAIRQYFSCRRERCCSGNKSIGQRFLPWCASQLAECACIKPGQRPGLEAYEARNARKIALA